MEIPKGHYIFGTVKVGERGQIVIPREARDKFNTIRSLYSATKSGGSL